MFISLVNTYLLLLHIYLFSCDDHTCYDGHWLQVKENGQSSDAKAKAKGFYTTMTVKYFVEFGHFLWDIVISLSRLSLALQKRGSSVVTVADQVDVQIAILDRYSEQ